MTPHNDPFSKCRKLLCLMPQAINFNFGGFFNNYSQQGDIFLHSEKSNLIPFSWNKEGQVTLSNYVTWEFAFAFYTKHSFTWNITGIFENSGRIMYYKQNVYFSYKSTGCNVACGIRKWRGTPIMFAIPLEKLKIKMITFFLTHPRSLYCKMPFQPYYF